MGEENIFCIPKTLFKSNYLGSYHEFWLKKVVLKEVKKGS